MKRFVIIFFMVLPVTFAAAQETSRKGGAIITWNKANFDFGDIYQGDKVEHTFQFTNTGTEPLVITNVEVTCGCTTPKGWPRDPIAPGQSAELTVAFNSTGKIGKQNKVITITSNSIGTSNQVMFTANVLERNAAKR
jgi:hypothetical protein